MEVLSWCNNKFTERDDFEASIYSELVSLSHRAPNWGGIPSAPSPFFFFLSFCCTRYSLL